MKRRALKVGIGQISLRMGDKPANLRSIFACIKRAAQSGCDVVVLPECSFAGWLSPSARRSAEPVFGPFTMRLIESARRLRLAVVVGFEEVSSEGIHNSAVLIDRAGEVLLHHRKVNELAIGRRVYTCGRWLSTADFCGTRVGVDICADSWIPGITDGLHALGARLIFSPCAWAIKPGGEEANAHWISETYRARTSGKDLTIVAVNSVGKVTEGPWRGRVLQGESVVTGPDGHLASRGPRNRAAFYTVKVEV